MAYEMKLGLQLHSLLPRQGGEVHARQGVDQHPLPAHAALPWQVQKLSDSPTHFHIRVGW